MPGKVEIRILKEEADEAPREREFSEKIRERVGDGPYPDVSFYAQVPTPELQDAAYITLNFDTSTCNTAEGLATFAAERFLDGLARG